jgi:hypothetical protein
MGFELDPSYKDVPARIRDFKEKYPDGCLRPADLDHPYRVETVGNQTFIVFVAAAYRTPDDPLPGIGTAWEPCPGKTPYTRDSELQNAETSSWGRAIVAVLASESKSIASAEDVRNRHAEAALPAPIDIARMQKAAEKHGVDLDDVVGHAALGPLETLNESHVPVLVKSMKTLASTKEKP